MTTDQMITTCSDRAVVSAQQRAGRHWCRCESNGLMKKGIVPMFGVVGEQSRNFE